MKNSTDVIQSPLNEISDLRREELTREERIALLQAEAALRLAEQVRSLKMPVAGVSSHILGLHSKLDDLISALKKKA